MLEIAQRTMKLKMKDDTSAEMRNGKPVYVDDAGREIEFDYAATVGTISRLNGEAKGHLERAQSAEESSRWTYPGFVEC